ncbi:MAG: type IX secretion system membrane protein PorP/SprF [Flavobacteriaceae bacterium]|nr:type IX secretion system membrane protein PorP/SprF [Flavobacteriaceae bacterium]
MKRREKYVCLLLLLLLGTEVFSQQEVRYTQYMYNMNIINPAYAGARETLTINMLVRSQWTGIEGAPKTGTLSIHSPFSRYVGVGLTAIYDEIGPVKETNLFADFSYTIKMSEISNLAFGIKAGATFHNLNRRMLNPFDPNDIILINTVLNDLYPNIGIGAFFYMPRFYIGISAPNLMKSKHFRVSSLGFTTQASEKVHYFVTAGYVIEVSNTVNLKPSILLKTMVDTPVDLSLNALFNEAFELGISYRWENSISIMVGMNVSDDFRIGYVYDYTLSGIGDYNSGSHELMLLYDFNRRELKKRRYF